MTGTLPHLLHRATRLRQRFDAERARPRQNPLLLLRLRKLLLTLERRMHLVLVGQPGSARPRPAFASATRRATATA